jgi:YD repeat-containing protein
MVDAVGTTKYTYTSAGNLLTEDPPWASDTVTYAYHSSVPGLRTSVSLQQPSGSWAQTYNPDAAKRLASVVSPAGTFTYTYMGAGNLWTNLVLPNTSRITNGYNSVGALLNTTLRNSGGTVLNRHEYQYNLGQQRTKHTRPDSSHLTFSYDNIGQLTIVRATNSSGTLIPAETKGYLYDTAWNLNVRTNNSGGTTTAFGVNVKNEITNGPSFGGYTANFTYDSNGNLTSRDDTTFTPDITYTYDAENH